MLNFGGVYIGDELLHYMVSIINHYDRIPIKQPGFNGKYPSVSFRGSLVQAEVLTCCLTQYSPSMFCLGNQTTSPNLGNQTTSPKMK